MFVLQSLAATLACGTLVNAGYSGLHTVNMPTGQKLMKLMRTEVEKIKPAAWKARSQGDAAGTQLKMAEQSITSMMAQNPDFKTITKDGMYLAMYNAIFKTGNEDNDLAAYLEEMKFEQRMKENWAQTKGKANPPDEFAKVLRQRQGNPGGKEEVLLANAAAQIFDQTKIQQREDPGNERIYIWKSEPSPGIEYILCTEHTPWDKYDKFHSTAVARVSKPTVLEKFAPDQLLDWSAPATDGGVSKLFHTVNIPKDVTELMKMKKPTFLGWQRMTPKGQASINLGQTCNSIYQTAKKQLEASAGKKGPQTADQFWDNVFKKWAGGFKGQRAYEALKPTPDGTSSGAGSGASGRAQPKRRRW